MRVNAQLIDAKSNAHLWAERFDRDAADLFELGNEITGRIANSLGVELIRAEVARPTKNPDAQDYILRGRAVVNAPRSREIFAEAARMYEQALALDPQWVEAQSRLANLLSGRVLEGLTDTKDADIARAEALIAQAGDIAARPAGTLCQRSAAARAAPMRRGHSRV